MATTTKKDTYVYPGSTPVQQNSYQGTAGTTMYDSPIGPSPAVSYDNPIGPSPAVSYDNPIGPPVYNASDDYIINTPTKPTTTPTTTTTTPKTNTGSSGGYSAPAPETPKLEKVDPSKGIDRGQEDANYAAYQNAMGVLAQSAQNAPGYQGQYDDALNSLYGQIMNHNAFSYNLNEDQLYQQYRDKYMAQAALSMKDTMGQAAGLTGGYGSSYGQQVGQQAYDAQLQQLNDIVPELYDRAYGQYQAEGQRMLDAYNMMLDRDQMDYGRYQDSLSQWNRDRDFAAQEADDAYKRWLTERDYNDTAEKNLMAERQNNLQQLLGLAAYGYSPTSQEIADAGVTPEQWQYYLKSITPTGGGSGKANSATYDSTLLEYVNMIRSGSTLEDVGTAIMQNPGLVPSDKSTMIEYIGKLKNKG